MSTPAERVAEYLRQRAAAGNGRLIIASPRLYANHDTQNLTVADLQEVTDIAADLDKATRAIKAQAWDEAIDWAWEEGHKDHHPDNPYRD